MPTTVTKHDVVIASLMKLAHETDNDEELVNALFQFSTMVLTRLRKVEIGNIVILPAISTFVMNVKSDETILDVIKNIESEKEKNA